MPLARLSVGARDCREGAAINYWQARQTDAGLLKGLLLRALEIINQADAAFNSPAASAWNSPRACPLKSPVESHAAVER